MTLNEFRAWFDGFSEAIGDAPTPEQWAKIKAKVNGLGPLAGLAGLIPQTPPGSPGYDPFRAGTSKDLRNPYPHTVVARN